MGDQESAAQIKSDLEALGFYTRGVHTVRQARDDISAELPAALVLDDRATRMRPLEVLEDLRSTAGHHVPVVLLSSIRFSAERMASMRLELGLGDLLCKPFSLIELVRTLRKFCAPVSLTAEPDAITDFTNPTEVFYSLLGRSMRSDYPVALARESQGEALHIFMEGPCVVAVTSSDHRSRSLDGVLLAEGLVRGPEIAQARKVMANQSSERKLGEVLVAHQLVSVQGLNKCLQIQAKQRFLDMFGLRAGTVRIQSKEAPPSWAARVNLDIRPLIKTALRQCGDSEVLGQLSEMLQLRKLTIPRSARDQVDRLLETAEERAFFDRLTRGDTVGQATAVSKLDLPTAQLWLAFLVYMLEVRPREKTMVNSMTAIQQLRMRRLVNQRPTADRMEQIRSADQDFNLGWKMMSNELFDQAVEPFRRTLEADPRRHKARACLGWCLYQLAPDPASPAAEEALKELNEAVLHQSRLGIAHLFMGRIYRDRGQLELASQSYLRALEVDSGNSEAMVELRQLHQQQPRQPPAPPAPEPTPPPAEPEPAAVVPPPPAPAPPDAAPPSTPAQDAPAVSAGSFDGLPVGHGRSAAPRQSDPGDITTDVPKRATAANLAVTFSLVLVEWEVEEQSSGDHSAGSVVLLDSQTKAGMVHVVRDLGASLEEFSLNGICAVVGMPRPVEAPNIVAAELALELIDALKRGCGVAARDQGKWHARGAVVAGMATAPDRAVCVGEAVAAGRRLAGLAGPWQVVCERSLFNDFANLVETRELKQRPQVAEVTRCLVRSRPPAPSRTSTDSFSSSDSDETFASTSVSADGPIGPGSMVDKFRVERLVGSGGMGEVFQAVDVGLGRTVALKMIRPDLLARPTALRRFKREAQALAKINSAQVTQIYALALDAKPPYLVMEFVDGASIHQLVKDEGLFSSRETAGVALQVISGLQAVYLEGLTHRDINPKNLLLTKSGSVKITDFGLVQMELTGASMSVTHSIVGTPSYMSPEQARGEAVDFRTDLYSLGMTLFHMMVGRPPFTGKTIAEILSKHIMEPVPSLRTFRPDAAVLLDELIQWLVAKKPDDRPQSYDAVASALRAILPD